MPLFSSSVSLALLTYASFSFVIIVVVDIIIVLAMCALRTLSSPGRRVSLCTSRVAATQPHSPRRIAGHRLTASPHRVWPRSSSSHVPAVGVCGILHLLNSIHLILTAVPGAPHIPLLLPPPPPPPHPPPPSYMSFSSSSCTCILKTHLLSHIYSRALRHHPHLNMFPLHFHYGSALLDPYSRSSPTSSPPSSPSAPCSALASCVLRRNSVRLLVSL
ncbi:hypothetical protein E2C01_046654 [Portunus trituberculatus]|uniref:Uncharacterized protein n=1 Tax=Portunus trituberculatus TaxID=210409 RepID=A0A5B7G5C9_PORTR|nr:hypothetical protein [Portunus trituberculatus]